MARMQKPERTCAAPKSSEPAVHASDNICTSEGLKTGVRALPVLSLSRLEVRSLAKCDLLTAKCLRMCCKSLSVTSSNFIRKCSISMS